MYFFSFIKKIIRTNALYTTNKKAGYVLLLSVLIAGIILAIAVSIANITLKGLILTSTSKNSQFAFYAADSGGECALYWDINGDGGGSVFPVSSESTPPESGVECLGQDIAQEWNIESTPTSATTEFVVTLEEGACAQVFVQKTNNGADTLIESHGLNDCDPNAPRRTERVLKVEY